MAINEDFFKGVGGVLGDQFPRRWRVWDLGGLTVSKATLTVKAALGDADPGLFQKVITTGDVAGTGCIEDNGATSDVAVLRFDIVTADSLMWTADTPFYYDLQLFLSDGSVVTQYKGTGTPTAEVTKTNT